MSTPEVIAGRYHLVRRVGSGAMGVVWEAWDDRLQRPVAIKQLHVQPGLSEEEAELAKNRAMREARITARLDHPNAVPVFDVVQQDGRPCLVMQFLPSTPLSGVLKERRTLPPVEAARIGAQVASALAAAHAVGIVHRDVKPGNILMARDGTARISDFGISHALGDASLTSTGMVHGTPAYLAPEVALGGDSSSASDVFGLGATIYAMLEGAPPFGTDPNPIVLLHRVASGRFDPPTEGGALTPVVLEMLATEPSMRPSMADVAQRLTTIATTQPVDPELVSPATLAFTREVQPVSRPDDEPATDAFSQGSTTRINPVAAVPPAAVWPPSRTDQPAAGATAAGPTPADPTPADRTPAEATPSHADANVGTPGAAPPAQPPSGSGRVLASPTAPRRFSRALLVLAGLVIVALAAVLLVPGLNPLSTANDDPSSEVSQSADPLPGSGSETATASASASDTSSPAPPTTSPVATPTPKPSTSQSSASATASSSPSKGSSPTQSSSPSKSSSPTASATKTKSPSSEPTSGTVQGDPSAAQLEDAITSYYDLLPGDRDTAWSLLTPSYQKTRAGGRRSYDGFWGDVRRVSVREVEGDPADEAEATIRYTFDDGRVVTEKTKFQLVNDDGTLKINRTTVVSSSTR